MNNRAGDRILSFSDFKVILNEFAQFVADKTYEKMDYNTWRAIVKGRLPNSKVIVSWNDKGIKITFEEDTYHFFEWNCGFGEFLADYIDEKWNNIGTMEYVDLCGVSHTLPIVNIKTQSTSLDYYPVKNYKLNFADNETFEANAYDTKATSIMETKVDKLEFNARIKELEEIVKKNANEDKENENMKTFNFDFGPVNGNVVRMSMYGLAVKNKVGTFVSYDTKSGEIIDVDVFNFDGTNFLYKMPVAIKDIVVGDVVIHHNAPMFVIDKSTDNKSLIVIDVIAGERKEIMLAKSPFGFNFATKVVNFLSNAFNSTASVDNPFGNMWMLMAMSGDNKNMNDMIPFMMMANGGNIDTNMLMFMAMNGNNSNDMLPMLMMMNAMNTSAAPVHECRCGGNCGEHHQ